MATIIIIKGEDATIKDIQDHEGDLIHDLCNHFMSNDIPNPTHPRKQLSHFQEQKLAETIRGFLIANFDEDAAWEVYESFLHETQYMSVFDTVNEFGERFELDPLSYFGTNGWRYDLTTIIESAHKISEVDLIGDIANELINSFFPDHVENGAEIHDELTTILQKFCIRTNQNRSIKCQSKYFLIIPTKTAN